MKKAFQERISNECSKKKDRLKSQVRKIRSEREVVEHGGVRRAVGRKRDFNSNRSPMKGLIKTDCRAA
jgi:hypothetical protein